MRLLRSIVLSLVALGGGLSASAQHNGTVNGSITYSTSGGFSYASGWSATNYIALPTGTFPATQGWAVTARVKYPAPNTVNVFFSCGAGGSSPAFYFSLNGNGSISAGLGGGSGYFNQGTMNTSGANLADGAAHFLKASMSSDGTLLTLLADGVVAGTFNGTYAPGQIATNCVLGQYINDNGFNNGFPGGYIGEVATFNAPDTSTTVPSAPYTGSEPNLNTLYHLNGNANDSVGASAPTGSVSVSPATFPVGAVTPFTMTGTGTAWTGSTFPSVSNGAFVSNVVVSGQVITGTVYPVAIGAATFSENTDSATASATVSANTQINIVGVGDSLTYGANGSNGGTPQAPRMAAISDAIGPTSVVSNTGVPGQTITQMISQYSSQINALWQAGKTNILLLQGGHNDYGGGATVSQVISRLTTFIATAKAAHSWQVVLTTEPPAANGSYGVLFDSQKRGAANSIIRATWAAMGANAVSDVAADSLIGMDGQEYNATYYNSDHIHFTDTGYRRWGSIDAQAILRLITPALNTAGTVRTGLTY